MITVVRNPLLTEKSNKMSSSRQYAFEVEPSANKIQIKSAIESMYEVNVTSVRTVRVKGKVKSRYTKRGWQIGRTNLRKKAYITLKVGQTLDIVEGEAGAED